MTHRRTRALTAVAAAAFLTVAFGPSALADHGGHGGHAAATIPLPHGFAPEDITAGPDHTFFTGSLANGAIYEGSFRSTTGRILVPSATGPTTGLYFDRGHDDHGEDHGDDHGHHGHDDRHHGHDDHGHHGHHGHGHHGMDQDRDLLWAAGGPSGQARVYDADSGRLLHTWQLAAAGSGSFISDVITTDDAAYYTDAMKQQLYVIPLRGHHAGQPRTVPLTGDVHYLPGANTFNLNGLAVFGDRLVSAQTVTGQLFAIDPETGVTTLIPLTDGDGNPTLVTGGDGIAQRGGTLYIAENIPNRIATVQVAHDLGSARLVDLATDPALDIPSSVEEDGGDLFGLNARFTTPPTPATTYDVVRVVR